MTRKLGRYLFRSTQPAQQADEVDEAELDEVVVDGPSKTLSGLSMFSPRSLCVLFTFSLWFHSKF